ncbi:EF-hand domain-containing protein [Sphingomonas sp. IC-56]|uniref:EF-hand domain-containing protein n=1 Tax=Sphingomonas sp. IC-56 TaxID=2898529 RepID=UPI001E410600|nr:EF-hand domain-containing protein [Sphingomonas sp. IC-56]MCD2324102.1 EF-hand domain-containing protein [Sphingomonas sp. IC-56]
MRILLLLGVGLASPALAQDRPAPPCTSATLECARMAGGNATIVAEPVAMMIAAFDADRDARVTRAEFDAGVRQSFEAVAPGGATMGYIKFADWAERWLGNRNALPSPFEVDADGSNGITADELLARFARYFAQYDANKDGVIVRSELLTIRAARVRDGEGRGSGGKDRRRRN